MNNLKSKDEIIIFQNQSHLVLKNFELNGIKPDFFDICLVTDLMVQFAMYGYSKELKARFDKMKIYIEEKYNINDMIVI
jgi:hypothetical protein